jgi:ABC-type polar amino acid transport system ATPase subunit
VEGADGMSAALLRVAGLEFERGSRRILSGVSFEVERGELVAIMGSSGSGKTTVLRSIAALEPFHGGSITVDAVNLTCGVGASAATMRVLRKTVGMVFQFHHLFEHLTALDNVCLAPIHAHGVPPREARRRAIELLDAFGVGGRAHALPRELSGGEAQRVAIARAIAVDPPLLLMDEPTASLDPERRLELRELLTQLIARGRTLVITTHDDDFARASATRVLRLQNGLLGPI